MRDCKRYARKRKVAAGLAGNFRGVCPILNRANGIMNTVRVKHQAQLAYALTMLTLCLNMSERCSGNIDFSSFFNTVKHETHGNV